MKEKKNDLLIGAGLLIGFVLWTLLIKFVDVQAVGPNGSEVGFASLNTWFHRLTGEHMGLYNASDWLMLVPILICVGFAALGCFQMIKRRSPFKVDLDIILLGLYYIVVILAYLMFEKVKINYRPVLIEGVLEPSYPSSTTLLVLSVMPTLKFQADRRVANPSLRKAIGIFVIAFSAFMVIARLVSGVHWFTDIVGGVVLSFGLFLLYVAAVRIADRKKTPADGK